MGRGSHRARAVVAAAVFWVAPALSTAAQQPEVGRPAPDFVLKDLHGDSTRLSTYRGHPVVLKFWASWCTACRTEMPELVAAREAHGDVGLVVMTVDGDDRPSKIVAYLAKLPGASALPVLVDDHRRVQAQYRIRTLPTTMFVDSAGVVRVLHAGTITADELTAGLRAILSLSN